MGIIVSGFSNIGKSFLSQKKDINCIDLDTCYFNKIEGWINIYVECLLALKEKYNYVLITTHGSVLNELNKSKYKIVLKSHEYLSDVINNIKL